MPERIWLLAISHRHGVNYYACTSQELALQELDAYVQQWWDYELTNAEQDAPPLPDGRDERIETYFRGMEDHAFDESYTIEELKVIGHA